MIAVQEHTNSIDRIKTVVFFELEGLSCYFEICAGDFAGTVLHTDNLYWHSDQLVAGLWDDHIIDCWQCEITSIILPDSAIVRVYWTE